MLKIALSRILRTTPGLTKAGDVTILRFLFAFLKVGERYRDITSIEKQLGSRQFKIDTMFDYGTPMFGRSLSETIAWCADQPLAAHPEESVDFRHRRALVGEANRLVGVAFERFNRNFDEWDRVTATPE